MWYISSNKEGKPRFCVFWRVEEERRREPPHLRGCPPFRFLSSPFFPFLPGFPSFLIGLLIFLSFPNVWASFKAFPRLRCPASHQLAQLSAGVRARLDSATTFQYRLALIGGLPEQASIFKDQEGSGRSRFLIIQRWL